MPNDIKYKDRTKLITVFCISMGVVYSVLGVLAIIIHFSFLPVRDSIIFYTCLWYLVSLGINVGILIGIGFYTAWWIYKRNRYEHRS